MDSSELGTNGQSLIRILSIYIMDALKQIVDKVDARNLSLKVTK
jgi:hypothetical protein